MSDLHSNDDPNLALGLSQADIDEHYRDDDQPDVADHVCDECKDAFHVRDIADVCGSCCDDLRDQIKHQQWLLDGQRKHAAAALDILRTFALPVSEEMIGAGWHTVRTATRDAIKLLEFASGSKAPLTTAGDVMEGLKMTKADV